MTDDKGIIMARDFLEAVTGYGDAAPAIYTPSQDRPARIVTVAASYSGTGNARVTFEGEGILGVRTYVPLTPVRANERVVLLPVGRTYVILGAIGANAVVDSIAAAVSRITDLETRNDRVAFKRVRPLSVQSSGGAITIDGDGTIRVTTSGVTAISVNDILDNVSDVEFELTYILNANNNPSFRYRKNGVDYAGATNYVDEGIYLTTNWSSSSVSAFGQTTSVALMMVNGLPTGQITGRLMRQLDASGNIINRPWQSNGTSRSGSAATSYNGYGDCGNAADHTGLTFFPGSSFNAGTALRLWRRS